MSLKMCLNPFCNTVYCPGCDRGKLHPSITESRIVRAVKRDDGTGFCIACGKAQKFVEPDAERYACAKCKALAVYGAEQLLLLMVA